MPRATTTTSTACSGDTSGTRPISRIRSPPARQSTYPTRPPHRRGVLVDRLGGQDRLLPGTGVARGEDDEQGRRDADSSEQWRYIGRKRPVSFSWVAAMKCDLRLQRTPFILDFWGPVQPTKAGISTFCDEHHRFPVNWTTLLRQFQTHKHKDLRLNTKITRIDSSPRENVRK
jgi:hypothetical protein